MHCLEPGCPGRLRVNNTKELGVGRIRRSRRCEQCGAGQTTVETPVPRLKKIFEETTTTAVLVALARGIKPSVVASRYVVSEGYVNSMHCKLMDVIHEDTRLSELELSPASSPL